MKSSAGGSWNKSLPATRRGFLKEGDLKPHRIPYWLTPEADDQFDEKVSDINTCYQQAPERRQDGERYESIDEMTGVQALERKHPGLPMQPGKVERREFEYIRHGTLSFLFNLDVALGKIVATSWGPTRNEQDFAQHIQRRVAAEPSVRQWHFITDNLNTHLSETLVRYCSCRVGYHRRFGDQREKWYFTIPGHPRRFPERSIAPHRFP